MRRSGLRVAFALEFLVACVAVFVVWGEVGGQGHLDIMPWHWKLICGIGTAASIVGFSQASAERERFWHRKSVVWFVLVLAFAAVIAGITVYTHETEPIEDDESSAAHAGVTVGFGGES
jgi:hypothetical protein